MEIAVSHCSAIEIEVNYGFISTSNLSSIYFCVFQKLPKTMLNELGMTVMYEEDIISIPLHLHRMNVDILKFPTKLTKTLTISAELPEHFITALHSLKLDKS